jgi:type IV secretion system protein VirB9
VTLEPSERVAELHVGDPVRWKVTVGTGGPGGATSHVLVKPTEPGVETDLLILTDRRTYVVRLVAHAREWMPRVVFSYPEEARRVFAAKQQKDEEQRKATTLPGGGNIAALDFRYEMTGDEPAWRPLRVYADGVKTYIQFPESMRNDEAPVLVTVGKGDEKGLVNYRKNGDKYIVDKVVKRALLVSGIGGNEERVEITHESARAVVAGDDRPEMP